MMCHRIRVFATLLFICGFVFVYYFPRHGILLENETNVNYIFSNERYTNSKPNQDFTESSINDDSEELTPSAESFVPNPSKQILCGDNIQRTYYEQRGDFWVLTNYFKATETFHCDESITYTTHAEYSYLDNLAPLLERWQGPLSLSIYCPGSDFSESLKRIKYLRDCSPESELIKMYATFHVFFDTAHMPEEDIPSDPDLIEADCSMVNPILDTNVISYRKTNNLTYPINMGRMIARDMSTTYYVLPSDIELYPSPNIIEPFLDMIRRNDEVLQSSNPKVFVLSIFEAHETVERLPYNKTELIPMLGESKIIPFHKFVCPPCHRVPRLKEWSLEPIKDGMSTFHVAKREGQFRSWEPIYIGTKYDPGYDIRLNWEGQRDKMTQGFILRLLDYEFHILDNAFLIHRPGIKRKPSARTAFQHNAAYRQNRLIDRKIYPEYRKLYGDQETKNVTPSLENVTPSLENVTPSLENVTPSLENVTPSAEVENYTGDTETSA